MANESVCNRFSSGYCGYSRLRRGREMKRDRRNNALANDAAGPRSAARMGSPLTTAQVDAFRFISGADPMSAIL